jgi:hypothetical protein
VLLATAEPPKPEPPPAPVQAVLDKYLKAVADQDLKAMSDVADVPWLDRDRQVVRDRSGLDKALRRVVDQMPKEKGARKVEAFSYRKMRNLIKDEAARKPVDAVLGEDGWLVTLEQEGYLLSLRTILIRVKAGKAVVVGGPLKENQLLPHNRIPEVVEHLFDKAETFELYSLDPDQRSKDGKPVAPKDGFHGWRVLGKTTVKEPAERKRLADALRLGAEDNYGVAAACFIPRHGIRLKGDDKTVDLVICFQCLQVEVYVDGKREKGFLTSGDPQPTFDAVLKAAGIQLAKPAKK